MKTSVIEVRDMLSVLTVKEVEKRIVKMPGVASATVNFAAKNATVRYDETLLEVADIKVLIHQHAHESAEKSRPKHVGADKSAHQHTEVPTPEAAPASASTPEATAPKNSTATLATPAIETAGNLDDPSLKNADQVASDLGADLESGLTSQEASRRLSENGRNELRSAPPQPAWLRFLSHFHDPLIYLLLAAIVIALVAWVIEGTKGWPVDAIVITIVVLFNGVLGFMQEAKAQNAVAALARMTAATSSVMREGLAHAITGGLSPSTFESFLGLLKDGTFFQLQKNTWQMERIADKVVYAIGDNAGWRDVLIAACVDSDTEIADALACAVLAGTKGGEQGMVTFGLRILDNNTGKIGRYSAIKMLLGLFTHHEPLDNAGTYEIYPRACNALRQQLFVRALSNEQSSNRATTLLCEIEASRCEMGRPSDEPRHPDVEQGLPWNETLIHKLKEPASH